MSTNRTHTFHWLFSISTAIIVYALFLFLFIPIQNGSNSDNNASQNKIYMLPVSNHNNKEENELLYWMRLNDPTLIIQPNRKYNYCRVLERKYEFRLMNTEKSMDFYNPYMENIFKDIKINKITLPDNLAGEGVTKYELFPNPEFPKSNIKLQQQKIKFPFFSDYFTGKKLSVQFPNSFNLDKLISEAQPIEQTILEVTTNKKVNIFPTVTLLQSSGSAKLDQLAINTIITQSTTNSKFFRTGKTLKIAVNWSVNK